MKTGLTRLTLAAAIVLGTASAPLAEPIVGTWLRTSTNTLVKYAKQGAEFCGTVLSGEYKGQSIGCLASDGGGNYKGKVIALDEGKTYTGKAAVNGNVMKLSGCVAGGLICKGENWQRQ